MDIKGFAKGKRANYFEFAFLSTVFTVGITGAAILPFYVYLFGAGIFWEFLGIIVCLIFVWSYEAYKLMRYARKNTEIISLPGYFKYRFKDPGEYLRLLAATEVLTLSVVIISVLLKEVGIIVEKILGMQAQNVAFVIMIIVSLYLGWFGINALIRSAPVKGVLMLGIIVVIVIYTFVTVGSRQLVRNIMLTDITGSVSEYVNILYHDGRMLFAEDYISLISLGLLASGMPFLLSSFFISRNSRLISVSKQISVYFMIIFFVAAACMGGISRGYLYPVKITRSMSDYFKLFYERLAESGPSGGFMAGLLLILIILAFVTAIEGSLHVIVTVLFNDIIMGGKLIRIKEERERLYLFCVTFVMGMMCFVISQCLGDISINVLVIFLATLGCSVAPTVLMSLVWKRMNKYGCMAGLVTGLLSVPFLKFAHLFGHSGQKVSLCDILGVNSVVPSMFVSFMIIIVVSLITPKPDEAVIDEFNDIEHRITN